MQAPVPYRDRIYLGTVLLERNRWIKGERRPTLAVSEWCHRIAGAGFDGLELWQNHALLASAEERDRLRRAPVPVTIFNSYARCESEALEERRQTAALTAFFGAAGVKFNFGRESGRHEEYCANVRAWRRMLPPGTRFLCECHGGTTMQDPAQAAATFARLGPEDYEVILHGFGGDEAPLENAFALHGRRVTHMHVCLPPPAGDGDGAVMARVALLRRLGFAGSFTIEFTEGVGDDREDIETLFRHAARDLRRLRQCLHRSPIT